MNKLMKIKIALFITASIYLSVYAIWFAEFYAVAETNWFVFSKVWAITVALAIITVISVPTEFFLSRLID